MGLQQERAAGIAAVRAAAMVCRNVQQHWVHPDTLEKKDRSPVTVADYASQAVVCAQLAAATAQIPVVGEEDARELRQEAEVLEKVVAQVTTVREGASSAEVLAWIDLGGSAASGRFWTLDPIDGTKGFLRKEQYAIALGLIEDGQVQLGVLGCPQLAGPDGDGVLFVAERGQGTVSQSLFGADTTETTCSVSAVADLAQARFCESVESGHSDQSASAQIARKLGIANEPVRLDSQVKYGALARGDAEIYLRLPTRADYREKIWDHAAGAIVMEEAGGRVTDVRGLPLDFGRGRQLEENRGVIASNGRYHDQILAVVQQVLGT
ncbi:MAG: 3'(2'),5'-bisphosphate nucleotidase [Planctomycetota bacterium]